MKFEWQLRISLSCAGLSGEGVSGFCRKKGHGHRSSHFLKNGIVTVKLIPYRLAKLIFPKM